jgi:hypothetical protein
MHSSLFRCIHSTMKPDPSATRASTIEFICLINGQSWMCKPCDSSGQEAQVDVNPFDVNETVRALKRPRYVDKHMRLIHGPCYPHQALSSGSSSQADSESKPASLQKRKRTHWNPTFRRSYVWGLPTGLQSEDTARTKGKRGRPLRAGFIIRSP